MIQNKYPYQSHEDKNESSISFVKNFGKGFKKVEDNDDDIVFEKEL